MQEIFTRRSVRRFTNEPVTAEQLERLLRAAMRAPSAGNEQPWEFVVLETRESLAATRAVHPYAAALDTAPCAVVVCGNMERETCPGYWVQDCSAAVENLLLEAVHLGLGAVWMGVYPSEKRVADCRALYALPENVVPLGIVALGHAAEQPAPADTFAPERIHRERW